MFREVLLYAVVIFVAVLEGGASVNVTQQKKTMRFELISRWSRMCHLSIFPFAVVLIE